VLEYIPGESLEERLLGPMRPRDAALLMAAIADAVHHIHQAGLLHLDLKPSNILLDGDPQAAWEKLAPKVADFGLAVFDSNHDSAVTTMAGPRGTPSYMAPEQATTTHAPLQAAADIHALGAVLYELLTGRPPFQGTSPLETLDQVRSQEPVPPRRLNPKIPRDLETIALKCLQKSPLRRYASADALASDLRRWLGGRPIFARPASPFEHAWRWCCRRPAVASLNAALAATVLISFAVLFAFYRRAEAQRRRAEAAHQRAEDQRQHADMARREAERNLEIASAVIDPLERLVFETFAGGHPLEGDRLDQTAKLLREQIGLARTDRRFPPQILNMLSRINWVVGSRWKSSGRLDEARVLLQERVDLMRQCRELEPGNDVYLWEMVHALLCVGELETASGRFEPALDHLDQATSLALETANASPNRPEYASFLFDKYRAVQDSLADGGTPKILERSRKGQLKVLSLFKPEGPDRPDQLLFVACALADDGECARARGFVERLASKRRPVPSEPLWLRQNVERALEGWFARESWHWASRKEAQGGGLEAWDREADETFRLLVDMGHALGIPVHCPDDAIELMTNALTDRAASQRKNGRLDDADRTIASLMASAQRLVREFPAHPRAHDMLGTAFMEESKQGWQRKDLKAIKQGLARSIEELQRALALDPHDDLVRRRLQIHRERLAALPERW
jgi:tetratricopeptide (TPR) repeat protein